MRSRHHNSEEGWTDAERFSQPQNGLNDSVLLLDGQGCIVEVNDRAAETYGYSQQELRAMSAQDLRCHSQPGYLDQISREVEARGFAMFETVHQRKDGSTFPVEVSVRSIEDDGAKFRQSIIRDVSSEKRAEAEAGRANRALRVLSACNQALVRTGAEDQLLCEICLAITQLGGYPLAWIGFAEHDSQKSVRVVEASGRALAYLEDVKVTWSEEETGRGPTGTCIRSRAILVCNDTQSESIFLPWKQRADQFGLKSNIALPLICDGAVIGALTIYGVESDAFVIEERRLIEELAGDLAFGIEVRRRELDRVRAFALLRLSELEFRAIFESVNDGMIIMDLDGRILEVNGVTCQRLGYSRDELLGMSASDLTCPVDVEGFQDRGQATLQTGQVFEVTHVRKDGSLVPVEVNAHVFEFHGAPAILGIARDITEWKAAQNRATQATREVEAANLVLRRQADDLQRAEALEEASNQILQLIARNELLDTVLYEIALLVEREQPGMHCAVILLQTGPHIKIAAAPTCPEAELEKLKRFDVTVLAEHGDSPVPELIEAGACAGGRSDLRTFCWVPIRNPPAGWLAMTRLGSSDSPEVSPAMTRAASLAGLALDHAELYEKLSFQAGHDSVTEVPNRLLFVERLHEAVVRSRRVNRGFAIGILDLDHFRQVNDLHGHRLGDGVLRQVAQRLSACVSPGDTVARLSDDEFGLILENLQSADEMEPIRGRLMAAFEPLFSVFDHVLKVTGSLGLSLFPEDATDPNALVRSADAALRFAKSHGRNTSERYHAAIGVAAHERLEIERHLPGAVERGELEVYYQLQHNTDREVCGMEALVRWHSPALGFVPPGKFIPIAENTETIFDIGSFVLRRACLQSVEWQRSGLAPTRIAVNVSTVQLVRPGFCQFVAAMLDETGLSPALLELEITETAMLTNLEDVVREIERLRKLGLRISIDDFGTGYSSLSYLQNLPVDAIKIDRSFIGALDRGSGGGTSIVSAIITLAHGLNLTVVAEGVETQAQLETLAALKCDLIQGHLLHCPSAASAVSQTLARRDVRTD